MKTQNTNTARVGDSYSQVTTNHGSTKRLKALSLLCLAISAGLVNAQTCPATGPITPPPGAISATIFSSASSTVDPNVPFFSPPYTVQNCVVDASIVTQNPHNALDQSTINIRVHLPNLWNGKLFMGGEGGFSGNALDEISLGPIIYLVGTPLARGYATVTTDTGHQSPSGLDGSWALNAPEKRINFAYKGVHLAALTAKSILRSYYGQDPSHSYFHGCSTGGRQGLMEASRYPTDFDGIISGAPVTRFTDIITRLGHTTRSAYALSTPLTQAQIDLITQTVLNKCDAKDGVVDGIINNPKTCHFQPKTDLPKCVPDVPAPGCFTSAQIRFINSIYQDIKVSDASGGKAVIREIEPGSETDHGDPAGQAFVIGWPSWITGTPFLGQCAGRNCSQGFYFSYGVDAFFIFNNPSFDLIAYLASHNDSAVYQDQVANISYINVPTYNLNPFKARGGKLVMYHGWIDAAVAPRNSIDRYRDIKQQTAGNVTDFARLFMVPGMAHCAYPVGVPQLFAGVDVLEQWVEHGVAPNALIATSLDFSKTRPICPYPHVAKLVDATQANVPAGWSCGDDDVDDHDHDHDHDDDNDNYNNDEDNRTSSQFND